jgi:hypothetical protein
MSHLVHELFMPMEDLYNMVHNSIDYKYYLIVNSIIIVYSRGS